MNDNPPAVQMRADVAALLAHIPSDGPKIWELEPPAARDFYAQIIANTERPPADLAVVRDFVAPGPDGTDLPMRLFDAREQRSPGPAVLLIHGGGFFMGSVDVAASFASHVAKELDLPVISVEYRLAPEAPFPAGPLDCEAAARWVASSPAELGREVTSLVITGDSAGGMLTIVTAMALRDKPAAVPVIVQAPLVPIVDVGAGVDRFPSLASDGYTYTPDGRSFAHELYQADLSDWRAAPLDFDQSGMPATLVSTTGLDILRDEGRAYAHALIDAGNDHVVYHEIADQIHGYYLFCGGAPSSARDVSAWTSTLRGMIDAETLRLA